MKKEIEEKIDEKIEEQVEKEIKDDEMKVDGQGSGDKVKELEPEEKDVKKTEDAIVIETQAEVATQ